MRKVCEGCIEHKVEALKRCVPKHETLVEPQFVIKHKCLSILYILLLEYGLPPEPETKNKNE